MIALSAEPFASSWTPNVLSLSLPPACYRHFKDKDGLLQEVGRRGFTQLAAAMELAARASEAPDERLLRLAHAYLDFALEQPSAFRVMFGPTDMDAAHLVEGLVVVLRDRGRDRGRGRSYRRELTFTVRRRSRSTVKANDRLRLVAQGNDRGAGGGS